MTQKNFKWKRPELGIKEAADQLDCKVEDLFHAASIFELTIYALIPACDTRFVMNMNLSGTHENFSKFHMRHQPNSYIAYVWKNPNSIPSEADFASGKFTADVTLIKEIILYNRTEANSGLTAHRWAGLQPLSPLTFKLHREGRNISAPIVLDARKCNADEWGPFVFLNTDLNLQNALIDDRLFVMKEDLQKLLSNETVDPDDAKIDGGVSRKTLLKLIIGMAVDAYGYDHNASKSPFPKEMERILDLLGINLSNDTILKALKEAAALLPANPHKT